PRHRSWVFHARVRRPGTISTSSCGRTLPDSSGQCSARRYAAADARRGREKQQPPVRCGFYRPWLPPEGFVGDEMHGIACGDLAHMFADIDKAFRVDQRGNPVRLLERMQLHDLAAIWVGFDMATQKFAAGVVL